MEMGSTPLLTQFVIGKLAVNIHLRFEEWPGKTVLGSIWAIEIKQQRTLPTILLE
jgi:hypothetical protein